MGVLPVRIKCMAADLEIHLAIASGFWKFLKRGHRSSSSSNCCQDLLCCQEKKPFRRLQSVDISGDNSSKISSKLVSILNIVWSTSVSTPMHCLHAWRPLRSIDLLWKPFLARPKDIYSYKVQATRNFKTTSRSHVHNTPLQTFHCHLYKSRNSQNILWAWNISREHEVFKTSERKPSWPRKAKSAKTNSSWKWSHDTYLKPWLWILKLMWKLLLSPRTFCNWIQPFLPRSVCCQRIHCCHKQETFRWLPNLYGSREVWRQAKDWSRNTLYGRCGLSPFLTTARFPLSLFGKVLGGRSGALLRGIL